MENFIGSVLVPAFFLQVVIGTAILAWWLLTRKDKTVRTFGLGMAGYSLGFIPWTILVLIPTKPDDITPLILAGAVPFLLANLAFAKVAYKNLSFTKTSLLSLLVIGTIAGTFIVRTFLYPSAPYFSEDGLLFFGLHPLSIAFYIATLSLTFLPAITVVAEHVKSKSLKTVFKVGLTTLFINAIIIVSSNINTLLIINATILTIALLIVWLSAVTSKESPLKK